ncbi:hypothetical protein GCM10025858_09050 [Alicyclobacillus sacchari]|nr:hypothetical protein GCM10025858_09050 [Alicyclobacillus sacchari]
MMSMNLFDKEEGNLAMYSKRRIIVRSGLAVGAAAACFLGVDSIHRSMQTQARLTYDHSRFAAHMAQTSPYMDLALLSGYARIGQLEWVYRQPKRIKRLYECNGKLGCTDHFGR